MALASGPPEQAARKLIESPCSMFTDARGERKRLRSSQEAGKDIISDRINGKVKNGFSLTKHDRLEVELSKEYPCNGQLHDVRYAEFDAKKSFRAHAQLRNNLMNGQTLLDSSRKIGTRSSSASSRLPFSYNENSHENQGNEPKSLDFKTNNVKNGFILEGKNEIGFQTPLKSPAVVTTSENTMDDISRESRCAGETCRPSSLKLYNNHTKSYKCSWLDCLEDFTLRGELARHVKEKHVEPMIDSDVFFCLWKGCKVYNRPSCSHKWLVKHMYAHVGNRPFKCVIDGCELAFATQNGLARHVPSHFGDSKTKRNNSNSYVTPNLEQESMSSGRRRQRSKWYLNRRNVALLGNQADGFDQLTMDYIKEELLALETSMNKKSWTKEKPSKGPPRIFGRRTLSSSREEVLVETKIGRSKELRWVRMNDVERFQMLKSKCNIFRLPNSLQDELYMKYFSTFKHQRHGRRK